MEGREERLHWPSTWPIDNSRVDTISAFPVVPTDNRFPVWFPSDFTTKQDLFSDQYLDLDCGSILPAFQHPADSVVPVEKPSPPADSVVPGTDREARVMRYREKRKNRRFEKTIRYASRKAYAETRPRVKGRFIKRVESEGDIGYSASGSTAFMLDFGYGVVPSFR